MTTTVVVVAAGSGERLGHSVPKAFVPLYGQSLLERSLQPLTELTPIPRVVVVAPESWVEPARELATSVLGNEADISVLAGGKSRTESVRRGLEAVSPESSWVLIHDAARALTPSEVFSRVLDALQSGAAGVIPVIDVVDTIVPVDPAGLTGEAHPRDQLGSVQTPQGFQYSFLHSAYDSFVGDATDDAQVLRAAGHEVVAVPGDRRSLKITYPSDLVLGESFLGLSSSSLLVGTGVDVHRFDPAAPLVLAGREFPGHPGLSGHSDGDVVLHAITDALLAAAGVGDLGTHFGVDREEFHGASSRVFVEHALKILQEAGCVPVSVSVQYIGNLPRLSSVRAELSAELSGLVGAPVNLSATTSDGLGLTGRGEGAAAVATALVERRPEPAKSSD